MEEAKEKNIMIDRFKEFTINQTKKIVDDTYDKWIEVKNKYDNKTLDNLSDLIYIIYEGDVEYSEYLEKKEYWFEKFKDEEIITNKLKRDFGWWKE